MATSFVSHPYYQREQPLQVVSCCCCSFPDYQKNCHPERSLSQFIATVQSKDLLVLLPFAVPLLFFPVHKKNHHKIKP
jgi:hypothetical protein